MIKAIKGFLLTIMIRIAIALKSIDDDLRISANNLFGRVVIEQKKRHRNPILNRMDQGTRDERYTEKYYSILKKADEVVRSTNPDKAAKMADKYGLNIGAKDKWGMRWEHHGFLDPKHKYYGKTLKEIRDLEIQDRKIKDDDYPIVIMFTNKSEMSFIQSIKTLKENDGELSVPEVAEMAKVKKFPLMVVRKKDNKDVLNKIEQLSEFVHVKSVSSIHYIIELFIPAMYGLKNYNEDSDVFKELIDIDQLWFTDDYGDKHAYRIMSFYKKTTHMDYVYNDENKYRYDVLKFKAQIIEELK